jgi:hypothetical protein
VAWRDRREVAPVERNDDWSLEPLGERDDRCIGAPEREICILVDQLGHACEVLAARPFDVQIADAEQELTLCCSAHPTPDEVRRLGHYQRWDNQAQIGSRERSDRSEVILIVCVSSCVQRPSVNYGQ